MYHCCWSIATCLMLEMISALLFVHFNYCLTTKIEVSKQRHRWVIDNIWFPNAHLCPVRPRVLDTCSLIYRAIHIREVYGTPLSQSLIQSYFLGPQTSLRCFYYPVLMPCYCFIYDCARYCTLYCFGSGIFSRYRQAPFGVPSRLQPLSQTLRPSRSLLTPLRDLLKGWPPEIFLNLVIALS